MQKNFSFYRKEIGQKSELSILTQAVIIALHEEGYLKIASKTNVFQSAVMRALKRKCITGCNYSQHPSGRPNVMSKQEDKSIYVKSKKSYSHSS